jgi:hypothetical protein
MYEIVENGMLLDILLLVKPVEVKPMVIPFKIEMSKSV